MKSVIALLLCVLVLSGTFLPLGADDGMWTFGQFPKEAVNKKYNFQVTDEFLDNLRLASVRIGDSGGGAFVSPGGLLVTNQHIVADCVSLLGTAAGHDYLKDGFYAAAQSAEIQCPGLEAGVLVSTEDVTKQVRGSTKDSASAIQQRNASIARTEKECTDKTGNRCMVIKLFSGARYDLYQYKPYTDLRLVFVPERQLAFFGAERDLITYLRYGLDVAFLRAYENGKPAATPHYIKWSKEGIKEGDLVFSAGNPRATQRLATASELNFYRDTALPITIQRMQPLVNAVAAFAAKSPENAQIAQPTMTALLTSYKLAVGKLIGLRDDRLGTVKSNFENKVKRAVQDSFQGKQGYQNKQQDRDVKPAKNAPDLTISTDAKANEDAARAWEDVNVAHMNWKPFEKPYQILEESPAPGSRLFQIARQLVRPPGQRNDVQRDKRVLESDTPVNSDLEILVLTQYLEELKALGDKEAPVKEILAGKTAAQAAEAYVKSSKLKDVAERKRLAASPDAVQKSDDGMIKLALLLDPPAQKLRKKHEDTIDALDVSASERIAQYRLKLFGATEYPDATGTGRVEYGVVKAYTDRANIPAPYASTFSGLYYRRNNEGPYQVPKRWVDLQLTLDLVAPLDFVSTCDIGGGDYGGAVVNRAGELVGVTFDGNVESLPDTYLYSDEAARAVHVASQGIVQALDKVYKATPLLQELGIGAGH
jgi:hypothetical protein